MMSEGWGYLNMLIVMRPCFCSLVSILGRGGSLGSLVVGGGTVVYIII